MSAAIPTSVPVFTTLQDDVDYVLADHQNNPNDEITALATMHGVLGKSQSWAVDTLGFLKNMQAPFLYKYDANTIKVKVGALVVGNSGQSVRLPRRITSEITVLAANLDTGAMAVGYYDVYAIADTGATTFTVKFCLAGNTPSGATQYEKIGWFYNETSSVLDITSGFVGNYKINGRDVPNEVWVSLASDLSTANTAFEAITGALLKFRSSGRPIEVILDGVWRCSNNTGLPVFELVVNAVSVRRKSLKDADGSYPHSLTIHYQGEKDAGGYDISAQWKVSAGTVYSEGSTFSSLRLGVKEL